MIICEKFPNEQHCEGIAEPFYRQSESCCGLLKEIHNAPDHPCQITQSVLPWFLIWHMASFCPQRLLLYYIGFPHTTHPSLDKWDKGNMQSLTVSILGQQCHTAGSNDHSDHEEPLFDTYWNALPLCYINSPTGPNTHATSSWPHYM